jgi:hypothetical protein
MTLKDMFKRCVGYNPKETLLPQVTASKDIAEVANVSKSPTIKEKSLPSGDKLKHVASLNSKTSSS